MGVLNPILPALAADLSLSTRSQSLIFSILIFAAAFGALGAGKVRNCKFLCMYALISQAEANTSRRGIGQGKARALCVQLADSVGLLRAQAVMAALFTAGGFMCTVASPPAPILVLSIGRLLAGLGTHALPCVGNNLNTLLSVRKSTFEMMAISAPQWVH